MQDLITAIGLAIAIEGMLYALFPDAMRKMIVQVLQMPTTWVRSAGLAAAVLGVAVTWLARGG